MKKLVLLAAAAALLVGNTGCGIFRQGAPCNSCCSLAPGGGLAWGGSTYVGHPMMSSWSGDHDCPECADASFGPEIIDGGQGGATVTPVLPSPAPEPGR